jgi:hypothetical protein
MLQHDRLKSCNVYAETGPDCGTLEVYTDDEDEPTATVDCYAATQTTSALVAAVTFSGPLSAHTIKARVASGTIKLDYFEPTYVPT